MKQVVNYAKLPPSMDAYTVKFNNLIFISDQSKRNSES